MKACSIRTGTVKIYSRFCKKTSPSPLCDANEDVGIELSRKRRREKIVSLT
jgi:hypothetical protein